MKIYVLVKHYEADIDFAWDYEPTEMLEAYKSKDRAEQEKRKIEQANGGETWEEDEFSCCLTIEEIELVEE